MAWLCVKVKCTEFMRVPRNYFNFLLIKCKSYHDQNLFLRLVFQYVIKFSNLFSNKEYLRGVVSRERIAGSQESFKDNGRIRGLRLAVHKCWSLEHSTTISVFGGFSYGNIATTLSCFVSLSDLNESNGINLLI